MASLLFVEVPFVTQKDYTLLGHKEDYPLLMEKGPDGRTRQDIPFPDTEDDRMGLLQEA